jgi:alpha-methylacyl-CoA racemase
VLSWTSLDLTGAARNEFAPKRGANASNGGLACYQIYRTADDQFVTLGIVEEKFWRNFCLAVDRPCWVSRQSEPLPQHSLIAEVAALFRGQTRSQWEAKLDPVETCFQAVLEHTEISSHPHIAARRMVVQEGQLEPIVEVLLPAWIDGNPPNRRLPMREVDIVEALGKWVQFAHTS